uniref:Uncharacterized protein n=1 Tax=Rangifer tarandus platyrhynchus TaxID=3082113 RepID=A0ACB0F7E6_RANTA|nr:unnamed protein product [Rangifer tarandus platyrhynchus]
MLVCTPYMSAPLYLAHRTGLARELNEGDTAACSKLEDQDTCCLRAAQGANPPASELLLAAGPAPSQLFLLPQPLIAVSRSILASLEGERGFILLLLRKPRSVSVTCALKQSSSPRGSSGPLWLLKKEGPPLCAGCPYPQCRTPEARPQRGVPAASQLY